jgi:quinol monooxygenase YgiN
MVIRIVRMHFRPDAVASFLNTFNESKESIRNFPGCTHMELFKDVRALDTFVTISHWNSTDALEAYRNSSLFHGIWSKTKPLFSAKTEAFTVEAFPGAG